jgi:cytochrome bd-type quinol oxidase subunit 2
MIIARFSAVVIFAFCFLFSPTVNAGLLSNPAQMNDLARSVGGDTFNPNANLGSLIAVLIQSFFGLLGIIFIILILLAGYQWMTARGDEDKVRKAQATIQRAIIGLIIIIAAYAITFFVFKALDKVNS